MKGAMRKAKFHLHYDLVDILPPSIQHVRLTDCANGHDVGKNISSFVSQYDSGFPNLKTIALGCEYDPDSWTQDPPPGFTRLSARQLLADVEAAGVKMIFEDDDRRRSRDLIYAGFVTGVRLIMGFSGWRRLG